MLAQKLLAAFSGVMDIARTRTWWGGPSPPPSPTSLLSAPYSLLPTPCSILHGAQLGTNREAAPRFRPFAVTAVTAVALGSSTVENALRKRAAKTEELFMECRKQVGARLRSPHRICAPITPPFPPPLSWWHVPSAHFFAIHVRVHTPAPYRLLCLSSSRAQALCVM
jgi:hypothetical protein